MSRPAHSVVIPAFNEEGRIGATVQAAAQWLQEHRPDFELIVVDDGSTDGTAAVVRSLQEVIPGLQLETYPDNRGKGHAVRLGMLMASGERRLFMDSDLATPMAELDKLDEALDAGSDIAIGSRGLPASDILVHESAIRERLGKTFNLLVRALLLGGIRDTQCGFKLFTGAVASDVFQGATLNGYAFDVEVLWTAYQRGYTVAEVPVTWTHSFDTRVEPGVDGLKMVIDVLRLRLGLGGDR